MPRKPHHRLPTRVAVAEVVAELAPDTTPPQPGATRVVFLRPSSHTAGQRVDPDTALTYNAVYACVRAVSESIAGLPWRVLRERPDGGKDREPGSAVDWMLHRQANPEMKAFQFRETILGHALTWGNGYAEIERDAAGRPLWMWLLTPDRVTPCRDARGRLVYDVVNDHAPNSVIPAEDMFHLHGLGYDGLVGYSPISLAARTIGLGMAAEAYGAGVYNRGIQPSGALQVPGKMEPEAKATLRKSFEQIHAGPANAGRVVVLDSGMTYSPFQLGLPPADAKFIESRKFTRTEVASIFRVPPHKIGDLERATFSNIEQQNIEWVQDTLMPWCERLESEADIKLFGRTNRGTMTTKINLNALLRGDSTSRSNFYKTMLGTGVYSPNMVLEFEDENPIGPDGDKRLVPVNMTTLEKIGEDPPEPPPAPPPAPGTAPEPPAKPQPSAEEPQDDGLAARKRAESLRDALRPVFLDVTRRVVRRELHRAVDGLRKHSPQSPGYASWLDTLKAEAAPYALEAFGVPVRALAAAAAPNASPDLAKAIDAMLDVVVAAHLRELVECAPTAAMMGSAEWWDASRAVPRAEQLMTATARTVVAFGGPDDAATTPAAAG